jgi:hypothetical protein
MMWGPLDSSNRRVNVNPAITMANCERDLVLELRTISKPVMSEWRKPDDLSNSRIQSERTANFL